MIYLHDDYKYIEETLLPHQHGDIIEVMGKISECGIPEIDDIMTNMVSGYIPYEESVVLRLKCLLLDVPTN